MLLPLRAPATMAPAPSSIAMIIWVCACASCSRILARWPPARWPVSCASTPINWFGVSDCMMRAVIDEDAAAVGDEGVERRIVDDDDLDVLLLEAGGAQDRPRVVAQQLLGLGVAQDRRAFLLSWRNGASGAQASATAVTRAVSFAIVLRRGKRGATSSGL